MRNEVTPEGKMLTPREKQYLMHHLKKGPDLDREQVAEYLLAVAHTRLDLNVSAIAEDYMNRWRMDNGSWTTYLD